MRLEVIRKTKSICPVCLNELDATIEEEGGSVFLRKICLQHGRFQILLSRSPLSYRALDQFYFSVMDGSGSVREYEMWPTLKCNVSCRICALEDHMAPLDKREPSLHEMERFVKNDRVDFYILSGGEPTCREDLFDIIRMLKKHRKIVTMNTNGLKLADSSYVIALKSSGLDRVNLQFDGFDRKAHVALRGRDLLDLKISILGNLKAVGISTILNATIAKNINEGQVRPLLDFASKNQFINGVNFFTICRLGGARHWPQDDYIMPDELIDIFGDLFKEFVTRKSILSFQKLHLALKSMFSQRYCFYNQVYVCVRTKGTYLPIQAFMKIDKIDGFLDLYEKLFPRSQVLAKIVLLSGVFVLLFCHTSHVVLGEFVKMGFSYFFKTGRYLDAGRFYYISFSTGCDPYKLDYDILKNCQNEIIGFESGSGAFASLGSDGRICIDLERAQYLKRPLERAS